jgi:hypothetical protein
MAKRSLNAKELRGTAIAALEPAGYRAKGKLAEKKAVELLGLPRIQAGIMTAFEESGVTIAKVAGVLNDVLDAPLATERTRFDEKTGRPVEQIKEGVSAGDKMRAADLFFKTTTGYAVAKSVSVQHHKRDRFFDESVMTAPPPIETTYEHEELP